MRRQLLKPTGRDFLLTTSGARFLGRLGVDVEKARKERRAFLKLNPHCVSPGCMERATVLDHRDGHQREDWAARFWDRRTWQPMCAYCHAKKSGAELAQWKDKGGGI